MRFIAGRVASLIPVILGATIFAFALVHLAPGDPVNTLLGPYASEPDRIALRSQLALDQPVVVQYSRWLGRLLTDGDLGRSIQMRTPVTEVLISRFANTLVLGIPSFILALVLGAISGVVAAFRHGRWQDKSLQIAVVFLATVPVFWLGLVLIYVFSLKLGWFPASGMGPIGRTGTLGDSLRYLVLPVITTSAIPAAIIARSVRSAVLQVLEHDHVWAAVGRGVSRSRLFARHILKPALPGVIHVSGLQLAYLLGGTVVFSEVVFSWPGIGLQTINAVSSRDMPMIQGVVLLAALVTVGINMAADLLHRAVDPQAEIGRPGVEEGWR